MVFCQESGRHSKLICFSRWLVVALFLVQLVCLCVCLHACLFLGFPSMSLILLVNLTVFQQVQRVLQQKQVLAKESQKNYYKRGNLVLTPGFLLNLIMKPASIPPKKSNNKIRPTCHVWIPSGLGYQVIDANSPMARTSSAPARPPRLVDLPRRSLG